MRQKILLYGLLGLVLTGAGVSAAIVSQKPAPPILTQGMNQRGQADSMFIEMMIPHHQDAVDMAQLALTRAQRPELQTLAKAIIQDQNREIKEMETLYQQWFGRSVPPLSGGMAMHQGHGMMAMDLEALKSAADFDREFIRQMIPHHEMAVMMASRLKTETQRPEMDQLADAIIQSQSREIKQMKQWYQAWYGSSTP
ncbi:MAG: DUF305 domain-containing protein [Cyanobacteriota bacterium]|jgi:uncharacterized protein (DUF305 family)